MPLVKMLKITISPPQNYHFVAAKLPFRRRPPRINLGIGWQFIFRVDYICGS